MTRTVAPGVVEIDTRLGGWEEMTAAYLVGDAQPVLVDPGAQTSVPVVTAALETLGVGLHDLAGIVVTHIHLDHAGAVGDLARAFPETTVHVHPRGARHLADPARLVASAIAVHGPRLDSLFGRLEPTPPERIHALEDGEQLSLGPNRVLATVHTPGHARHHLALHDSGSGIVLAGDAIGLLLPGTKAVWPATPPPDFDLDHALASLRRLGERRPSGLALAHYGLTPDPESVLEEAASTLRRWGQVARTAWEGGAHVATAVEAAFDGDASALGQRRARVEALNGLAANAAGFAAWLDRPSQAPPG